MANTTISTAPSVVSADEWRAAIDRLREQEDALNAAYEAVNADRRMLPMVEITGDYRFEGPDGDLTLPDLFNGRSHLVTYHFMFAPDWVEGCPNCTRHVESLGDTLQLRKRDIEFALISRAPVDKLKAWKDRHGWQVPWYSGETAFSADMGALPEGSDSPAMNVFYKDDAGKVYRTYFTNSSLIVLAKGLHGISNLTLQGTPEY